MLQRELWAVFDWSVCAADGEVHPKADEPAAIALRGRLATIIRRLALGDRELADLGDNYRAAVQVRAFRGITTRRAGAGILPSRPDDPDSPWLCINPSSKNTPSRSGTVRLFGLHQVPGGNGPLRIS